MIKFPLLVTVSVNCCHVSDNMSVKSGCKHTPTDVAIRSMYFILLSVHLMGLKTSDSFLVSMPGFDLCCPPYL